MTTNIRATLVASTIVLLHVVVTATAAEIPTTPSRVTAVTVHVQQARVTREAEVALAAGLQRIVLKPLPASLDPASVRVSGRGIAGVAIRGVELRRIHEEPEVSPETASLEASIRDLARQSALTLDRKRSIGILRDFITGLKAAAVDTSSRDLLTNGFATDDWESAFDFLSSHLDRLAEEEGRVDREYGDLSRRLTMAQSRLAEGASSQAPERFAAEILVSTVTPGTARLALTYLVDGASWTPLYDARLDPAAGSITLDWLAQVRQDTGEDWDEAGITLTTSQPQKGIDLPRLASVRLVDPARRSRGGFITVTDGVAVGARDTEVRPILGRNYQDVLTLGPGGSDTDGAARERVVVGGVVGGVLGGVAGGPAEGAPPLVDVPLTEATAAAGERSMQFALPGPLTIPGDGQWHQHLIASRVAPAMIEYQCIPALSPEVFLVARLTLPEDVVILPGLMAHFVDGDLVGHSVVAARGGGEELTLSFGPEGRVRADRRDLVLKTARRGRDEERDRLVVTTLRNHLGRPVTVKVGDRIPVSGDDRIDVVLDRDETTAGLPPNPREPGILRWEVPLPAAGTADITLRYRIRAPAGMLPVEP